MSIGEATLRNASLSGTGEEITVSDDADLQERIDSADYGDTLVLEQGTHDLPEGGIEIGSYLTIEGETDDPEDVILSGDDGHDVGNTNYLNVKSYPVHGITLRGITVDSGFRQDSRDWDDVGLGGTDLAVISADNSLVENCRFLHGTGDCLDISQSQNLTIRDCLIEKCYGDDALEINDTTEPVGVPTTDPRSDNIRLENCTIREAGMGWYLDGDGRHWCNGIEIEGAAESGTIVIEDCLIEDSVGLDFDLQSEEGIDPYRVQCYNNNFATANDDYISASFEGTPGEELFFDDDNTFVDDDIDNVLTGHRENVHAPAWGIEND